MERANQTQSVGIFRMKPVYGFQFKAAEIKYAIKFYAINFQVMNDI